MTRFKFSDKYGFVGVIKQKRVFINPQFDYAGNFYEGLAVVEQEGKQGYIDTTGEFAIPPHFDKAHDFSEGLARVKTDNKYGYIDKEGRFVISPQFDDASDFRDQYAKVKIGKIKAKINRAGKFIEKEPDKIFIEARPSY